MGDARPALDVRTPARRPDLIPLLDALLDDFQPFAVEQLDAVRRRIHFFSAVDRDDASRALQRHFGAAGVTAAAVEVPDDDWAARSQARLTAVRIGDIVVAPPWDVPAEPGDGTLVVIRPSTGFGTGHHASTRLCLRALQAVPLANRNALDLGTGSGVLAIAAARRGATSVVAIDTDRDAVATALDNVELNGVSGRVRVRCGDFRRAALQPAAIVVANLNATLAARHGAALVGLVTDGFLVLGGITAPEEAAVRGALGRSAALVARHAEEEWVALTLAVRGGAPRRAGS